MTKLHYISFICFFLFILLGCKEDIPVKVKPEVPDNTDSHVYPTPKTEPALAFPGAYGGGREVTGGRGGKVYKVTSLEDTNTPGTLRYALSQQGPRIVIFELSGTIYLTSKLNINIGNLTIAGQSAPGDGICIANYPVEISAGNVIIRYLRFRMGDRLISGADGADALGGRKQKGVIIDHCSVSWSTDECSSFYDNEDFTMQWCIISESLRLSAHSKGPHGYGGIWGGVNASFHHNLIVHHDSRIPRFAGSRYSNKPSQEKVDFRNNVLFNWGANNVYGAEGGSYNIVNNYYKFGPASSNPYRIIQVYADDGKNAQPAGTFGRFYVKGNNVLGSTSVSNDNSLGVHLHSTFSTYAPAITKSNVLSDSEFDVPEVHTHTSQMAYEKVLAYAGCSKKRDDIDSRIIEEVKSGTVQFKGLSPYNGRGVVDGIDWKSLNYPKSGIIDSQNDLNPDGAEPGWTAWTFLKSDPPQKDTDGDGIPDDWEIKQGLDHKKDDAAGRNISTVYDNIEVYLNSLVEQITLNQY